MREIKFRAWHSGRMWPVAGLEWHKESGRIVYIQLQDGDGVITTLAGGPLTKIEQFTGLHDKDGREIYEGDILVFPRHKIASPFVVVWSCRDAAFSVWHPRDQVEVIGNIHENPELLELGAE